MVGTKTKQELLEVCIWDLAEGCRALVERLPGVARHASDAPLRTDFDRAVGEARERAARLDALIDKSNGPENLWMAGILDDAERDTESVAPGELLDVAMIGAIRKAFHAEVASIHTAQAMARACFDDAAQDALDRNLAELEERDGALFAALARVALRTDTEAQVA